MNSRRSFLKSVALIASAASVCPNVFVPKFEPVKWKIIGIGTPKSSFDPLNYCGEWEFVSGPHKLPRLVSGLEYAVTVERYRL